MSDLGSMMPLAQVTLNTLIHNNNNNTSSNNGFELNLGINHISFGITTTKHTV